MAELKPGWRRIRFSDMVTSAGATRKARGWNIAEAGVDRYVGLEQAHADPSGPTFIEYEGYSHRPRISGYIGYLPAEKHVSGTNHNTVGMCQYR